MNPVACRYRAALFLISSALFLFSTSAFSSPAGKKMQRASLLYFSGKMTTCRNGSACVAVQPVHAIPSFAKSANEGLQFVRLTLTDGRQLQQPFNWRTALSRDNHMNDFATAIAVPRAITTLEIMDAQGNALPVFLEGAETNNSIATKLHTPTLPLPNLPSLSEKNGQLYVEWPKKHWPWLVVTYIAAGGARQVIVQKAQGGKVALSTQHLPPGGQWEISLSSGLNAAYALFKRKQGAHPPLKN